MNNRLVLLTYKVLVLFFVIIFSLFQNTEASELPVQKGILDLQNWDFSKDGTSALNGEWEFYPWKYYSPEQLSSGNTFDHKFVSIPGSWTNYLIDGVKMPGFGYATFRMKIIINKKNISGKQVFALKLPGIFSAYKLWIDSTSVYQKGIPGKNFSEHKPEIIPVIIPFLIRNDTTTLTIQVGNYFASLYGGIKSPIYFGLYEDVNTQSRIKEFWYIGGAFFCFTLGFYYIFLFLLKQERKINLLFAFTCIFLAVRYMFDNEYIILLFFPYMNPSFMFKVLLLCLDLGPVMLWTAYLFFPREINKRVLQLSLIIFTIFSLYFIFAPTTSYGHLTDVAIISVILILIYIIVTSGIAYWNKRESAGIFFFGTIITPFIFGYNMFLGDRYYIPVGALFYLIIQASAITSKFVHSHERVIKLSEDLQLMNEKLELLVIERTKELHTANVSLQKLNFAKDRFISILSHDLRNPLNSLIGLSRRLFSNAEKNNTEKVISYSKLINESAVTCHTLTENLLDWSLIQSGTIGVSPTRVKLKDSVDNVFDLLKNESVLKKIELINCVDIECEIYADSRMVESVLRNLITNSIKFTEHNGRIEVTSVRFDEFCEISVKDTGIGMDDELLKNLFRIDRKVYNLGTDDEPGSGFGLILTKEFVEINSGSLKVESEKGKGTVVSFTLPVYKAYAPEDLGE